MCWRVGVCVLAMKSHRGRRIKTPALWVIPGFPHCPRLPPPTPHPPAHLSFGNWKTQPFNPLYPSKGLGGGSSSSSREALGCKARPPAYKEATETAFTYVCLPGEGGGGVDQSSPGPKEALRFLKPQLSNCKATASLQNPFG